MVANPTKVTLAALTLLFATAVHSAPIALVGGAADPYNIGFVPVPPNEPIPFSSSDIAAMTDGNLSTSYTFSSSRGQYSSHPNSVVGYSIRYDFDISGYSSIDSLTFDWTGLLTWVGGNGFPDVVIGFDPTAVLTTINFGSGNSPDNIVRTGIGQFTATKDCFCDVSRTLHGPIASVWVSTGVGFSTERSTIDRLRLDTFEVSATVTGTPAPAPVPVPAAAWLLLSGLGPLVAFGKRRTY